MDEREGRMAWNGHETWYRVVGDLESDASTPVVDLSRRARARRTTTASRSPISPASAARASSTTRSAAARASIFRTPPRTSGRRSSSRTSSVELTRHLGIADRYAVVGQSWGGMLAMEHALDHPVGLRGIVVADSPASMTLWVSEANRLREDLPPDVQVDADEARGGRDDRRPRVRDRRQGLLRSPPLPGAVAGLRCSAASIRSPPTRPCTTR